MRAAIYIRVSTKRQAEEGYSLDAQMRQCREYAAAQDWRIVAAESDDETARHDKREGLQKVLELVRQRRVDVVLIHNLDRFVRNLRLLLNFKYEIDTAKVRLVSLMDNIDTSTPEGIAGFQLKGLFAEWYSNSLSREVRKGLTEKAKQGDWIGLPPLGYCVDGQTLAFSEDAETPRLIFTLYSSGNHTDRSIAKEANERNLTIIDVHTGLRRPFTADTVRGILTNPAYIGIVRCGGKEYPGNHPALIERDVWERCQAIRAQRGATRLQGGGRAIIRGPGGLLSELAYCGKCGARLNWSKGDKKEGYYICRNRIKSDTCDATMIMASRIHPLVLDVLRALTIPPHIRDEVIAEVERRLAHPAIPAAIDAHKIREQLRRLSVAYRMGDPDLDDATYQKERDRLLRMLAQEPPPPPKLLDLRRAVALLSDMAALLDAATIEQQRAVLRQVLQTVWIEKFAVVAIQPTANYAILVETIADGLFWRPRLGSNQQPSAPEADALSN